MVSSGRGASVRDRCQPVIAEINKHPRKAAAIQTGQLSIRDTRIACRHVVVSAAVCVPGAAAMISWRFIHSQLLQGYSSSFKIPGTCREGGNPVVLDFIHSCFEFVSNFDLRISNLNVYSTNNSTILCHTLYCSGIILERLRF
jgi:hypothetical protein